MLKPIIKHPEIISWTEMLELVSSDPAWDPTAVGLNAEELESGISLERLWQLLDQAWFSLLCGSGSQEYSEEFLARYYAHPVWLLNGAFSESDPETISDRLASIRLLAHAEPKSLLDFGGGFGTVARLGHKALPSLERIEVFDVSPFSSTCNQHLEPYSTISLVPEPQGPYDAVVATEVLEHLLDPIAAVIRINRLLKPGGVFVASWSFGSGIRCHIPQHRHLRHSMLWIIRALGFGFYGFERRGTEVYCFHKQGEVGRKELQIARMLTWLSRLRLPMHQLLCGLRGI